ncbi:MAG TPA: glucan biosynthesis protein D [Rudaea sp.]|nr:glucan biosynthesis protein D [Rudaea sp.]
MKRRDLMQGSILALAAAPFIAHTKENDTPFDYAWLKGEARRLASQAYSPRAETFPLALARLDWDQYQRIRFRPERAIWADAPTKFRLQFFHLGLQYRRPVRIHVVEEGRARDVPYDPAMFDFRGSGLDADTLPRDLGFAGFRIHFHKDFAHDVTVFLGASYFRAVGASGQYGMSARGLAVDCGMTRPEEFPDFTAFWIVRPAPDADTLTVYALLDSPSVAGAYRFDITPGDVQVMRVDAALYPRKKIDRLGIAPLTSMFLCAEYDRRVDTDWRPAIHDSDGLAMWTGAGEWIWRPLTNPANVRFNAFQDAQPRGFGLLQRDRNFDHYQDDGVFYDRRPGVWVEPLSGFARGAVDLLEIPAGDETADNIVAFWTPAEIPEPGRELLYAYRLYWGSRAPAEPPLARTAMTWSGIGGVVGQPRRYFSWRFVVDFQGGDLASLRDAEVDAVVDASEGQVELVSARPLASIHGCRAMFDVKPGTATGQINLRLYLRRAGKPLTETWLYQWTPPAHPPT